MRFYPSFSDADSRWGLRGRRSAVARVDLSGGLRAARFHVPLKLTPRDVGTAPVLLPFDGSLVDPVVELCAAHPQDARGFIHFKAQRRE